MNFLNQTILLANMTVKTVIVADGVNLRRLNNWFGKLTVAPVIFAQPKTATVVHVG